MTKSNPIDDGFLTPGESAASAQSKFKLGMVVETPGVAAIESVDKLTALRHHSRGNWGEIEAEDAKANDDALKNGGGQLHSVWRSPEHRTFWIITGADREVTTILLPDEY